MKIVYSYYVMDIVHRGHILMMENAKAIAGKDGKLCVAILTDKAVMEKKPAPAKCFNERILIAKSLAPEGTLVIPQETYSPLPNVRKMKPDVLMESTSHGDEAIKEAETVLANWGGKVIVLPYYPEISSTKIKKRIIKQNTE